MKRSTEEISKALEAFPKMDLEDIRNFFGAAVPSRVCKRDFVEQLGAFIVDRLSEFFPRMRLFFAKLDPFPEKYYFSENAFLMVST